ncbi:hypothetical protein A7U60_g5847 [Sanghuangporus baumii]|uniref:RING-type domain-containing protein n=1 Tax=Sanghuangporus baumii TaxID=108892 RepID=A0A9Q5HWL5_SANBA|nr:hypothetical protein A7U60_g5847 [Sanghuangporus baumii]
MAEGYPYLRVFLFFCTTVMSVLPAISMQNSKLESMDIFRVTLNPASASDVHEVRFGVWSFCLHGASLDGNSTICDVFSPCNLNGSLRLCSQKSEGFLAMPIPIFKLSPSSYKFALLEYGYELTMTAFFGENTMSKSMSPAWTRPFVAHAAAAIATTASFILLHINHPSRKCYAASLVISGIALICDIAVSYRLKALVKELKRMNFAEKYSCGPGLVLQIISTVGIVVELVCTESTRASLEESVLPRTSSRFSRSTTLVDLGPKAYRPWMGPHTLPPPPDPVIVRRCKELVDECSSDGCPICLELKALPFMSQLPCNHIFCTECIYKSVKIYKRCPVCNRPSNADDVTSVAVPASHDLVAPLNPAFSNFGYTLHI